MNDKDWLNKVQTGFKVYQDSFGQSKDIEKFIKWLYKEYGIVYKEEKEKQ